MGATLVYAYRLVSRQAFVYATSLMSNRRMSSALISSPCPTGGYRFAYGRAFLSPIQRFRTHSPLPWQISFLPRFLKRGPRGPLT